MSSRILVCGDIMLDRYWHGNVTRLSQEAPVPVVKHTREECRLGAAANVAAGVAALGHEVTLIGIIGQDECEDLVFDLVAKAGINAYLLTDPSIKTTQKLRVIGRNQQIVRIDFESKPSASIREKVMEQIPLHDIIVFSDYGKGALVEIRKFIAATKHQMVLVDPKGYNYAKYFGADLIKPNVDEMREMVGGWESEDELRFKADKLRRESGIASILLTRAADGMTLYNGSMTHIHAKQVEVFDVTGAGDTVMASLAVYLSHGCTLIEAAEMANHAAGISVSHFGTYAVTRKELEEACNSQN